MLKLKGQTQILAKLDKNKHPHFLLFMLRIDIKNHKIQELPSQSYFIVLDGVVHFNQRECVTVIKYKLLTEFKI